MKTILYLMIPLAFTAACSKSKKENKSETTAPVPVSIAQVSSRSMHALLVSGKVESEQSAILSTRMMGYVEEVLADVGDHVSKGQLLIRINNSELKAKQAQAEAMIAESQAALKSAQKDLERFTKLHDQNSATDKELEEIQLQFESAKAKNQAAIQMRNEVQAMQQFTFIRAAYDGQITQKMVHTGDLANPGMPLMTLEQQGPLVIVTMIPEKNRLLVKEGTTAFVDISAAGVMFETAIRNMSSSAVQSGGQYLAKLSVPSTFAKRLLPGMYATISLQTDGSHQTLSVPTSSIIKREQLTGVYVYSNHKAYLRWLKVGEENSTETEVLTGLKASDTVIVSPGNNLKNGIFVMIK